MRRRRFLGTCGRAGLAWAAGGALALPAGARPALRGLRPVFPDPRRRIRGDSSVAAAWRQEPLAPADVPTPGGPGLPPRPPSLAQRFPDLRRHFIFEYYPWWGGPPLYEHWDQW